MTNQFTTSKSYALASRFLYAFQSLNKVLLTNRMEGSYEDLNVSQIRILQLVHDDPGIRADVVMDRLGLAADMAGNLILAMEKTGLLTVDRSSSNVPPCLRLGRQGQQMAFQFKAAQLSILADLLSKLPEDHQLAAVESLEQLASQQSD